MTTPSASASSSGSSGSSAQQASDARASVAARIAEKFGAANVAADAASLAAYEVDGMRPAAAVKVGSAEEIAEVLRFAAAEKLAVIPCGGRTKLGIGAPPTRYDVALDVSRMNRVLAYEPRDLTLGVQPGVGIGDLWSTLACERQWLPLISPFAKQATIGGILASDSASPLRHAYGGPRDFTLGMEFVTGYGAAAKSGGRVVKNVSGYDMHKLLIGSLGTLAVITRVNFKTFPFPPSRDVFVAQFKSSGAAMEFCRAIQRSALEPRLVEVISPEAAKIISSGAETPLPLRPDGWSVAIGVAAHERVVERHARELAALAAQFKASDFVRLGGEDQSAFLYPMCEFPALVLAADPGAAVFRIAALPATMAALAERLASTAIGAQLNHATVLRPHGLVILALMNPRVVAPNAGRFARAAQEVFHACAEIGAKARIEWAPVELKRAVNVWGEARPDFELMRRVKHVFDPGNILSPGRFAGGV
ncbi:MAG: FAD-binding oxidoreductase [Candidatus Acidiferrales bacterium]